MQRGGYLKGQNTPKKKRFFCTFLFSLVPFCHILVLLSCKIRLLTGPIPQVCGGNASREAASPKRRPSCWASRPDNSMQDLSCSQTDKFLARTCLGSVSSCVFRCLFDVSARTTLKSIHLTSSNRQPIVVEQILLGNLLEANVPKNQRQHEYVCTETHTS